VAWKTSGFPSTVFATLAGILGAIALWTAAFVGGMSLLFRWLKRHIRDK
jgi:hypothetical protein